MMEDQVENNYDRHNFIASSTLFPDGFFMQKHKPVVMNKTHNHNHVEVMLPVRCAVEFATHAGQAIANDTELCLLWGQLPHRVTGVDGGGMIYIANIALQDALSLGMPDGVVEALLSGQLVTAAHINRLDAQIFDGWVDDYISRQPAKVELARTELQCRLRRQSLAGWRTMLQPQDGAETMSPKAGERHMMRIQRMIRFMAENYTQPITVGDIAEAGGVSAGYAMGLFRKTLGMSVTSYLTKLRLYHAKTALVDGGDKILTIAMDSGFGSLSRFYEVFTKDTGQSPQAFRHYHKM